MSDNAMVNMSRDEVVEALNGIRAIDKADSEQMAQAIDAITEGVGEPRTSTKLFGKMLQDKLNELLNEAVADALILNDRSAPLVRRITVEEQFNIWAAPYRDLLSESGDRAEFDTMLKSLRAYLADFTEKYYADNADSYDRKWREIGAYRALVAKYGTIDVTDRAQRDTFYRLSTTAEEWLEESNKAIRILQEQFALQIQSVVEMATNVIMAEAGVNEAVIDANEDLREVIAEWKGDVESKIAATFDEMMAAIQGDRDRRYLELWAEPQPAQE